MIDSASSETSPLLDSSRQCSRRSTDHSPKWTLEELSFSDVPPVLRDGLSFIRLGVKSILKDDFTECFLRQTSEPITAKAVLMVPFYCIGWFIRYLFLFPYRLLHLISATTLFLIILPFVVKFKNQPWKSQTFTYYCRAFLYSWGSRIRYHGKKVKLDVPHIFVSNHTSFIDYIVLSADSFVHSTVAQKHGGIIGWFETCILTLVGSLIFERTSKGERKDILPKIRSHISNPKCAPLLVFPEGTCVNNDYTVLFHKGIFELDCLIVPVAIKYDKKWADAYWHTKTQTFTKHLFYLMTRWALIADVWYLPPRIKKPGQTASQFAAEIKAEISDVAGLKNLSWDGYYKNYVLLRDKQASLRASPQSIYVNSLLNRMNNNLKSSKKLEYERTLYRPSTKSKLVPIDNYSSTESIANLNFQTEDPIVSKNKLLVEISNSCNLSVIESYSLKQAGILNAFESYSKNDKNTYYVRVRTDNITMRSWFKRRRQSALLTNCNRKLEV